MNMRCQVCRGTGYRVTVEECPHCGQDMFVRHASGSVCEYCKGTGEVEYPEARIVFASDKISASGNNGGSTP